MSLSLERLAAAVSILCCCACSRDSGLPRPGSTQYRDLVSAFYVGLAGLQTGEDVRARESLTQSTKLAPAEPAPWADLALLEVRQQNFDAAFEDASRAHAEAPDESRIEMLMGLIESRRGKLPEALNHLSRAVELDPKNVKAAYVLAQETERRGNAGDDTSARNILQRALGQRPGNVALLLEVARLSAKAGDSGALQAAVAALGAHSGGWPAEAKEQFASVRAAASAEPRSAAVRLVFLRNVLARVPEYRRDLNEVQTPAAFVSDPFTAFLKLPVPSSEPAPADLGLRFEAAPALTAPDALWASAAPLDDTGKVHRIYAAPDGLHTEDGAFLPFSWKPGSTASLADLNYDFLSDFILAGPAGLRVYRQKDPAHFARVSLPATIESGPYTGAWPYDIDLDGDLDLVLGNRTGLPRVLRNNGNGMFAVVEPFAGIEGLTAFAGTPDSVALLDASGRLHVFTNERLGVYRETPLPSNLNGSFRALISAGLKADGDLDFVLLRNDGAVLRRSDGAVLAHARPGGSPVLRSADFDNNGAPDLLVGDGQIFLATGSGFTEVPGTPRVANATPADLNGDGRMDLIGASGALLNRGTKSYHWQDIQVRAASATGDQRINSFGIGGDVQVRAGLLAQKQPIASQLLHFGLGEKTQVDVARITWPNGVAQAEFALKANQRILASQRLKGSCPWLFAWNGTRMAFVKDGSPWSPALGLHINAQVVAGIGQTREWFKIPGDALKPRDGDYDIRITGELWETYYIDHYSLMVVDHPAGTEVFTDERFAVPSPPLRIYSTGLPRPFAAAHDDLGQDVSSIVRSEDAKYLDTFGRGQYQGLTRDHWVELELPADAPEKGPLYLLASGWLHPTDTTVNVAIGQNPALQPRGLSIEVPDALGRWHVAKDQLGFPAGKMKTIVLDLGGIFSPGAPRRFRLRTNLEIYWDKLAWAAPVEDRNRIEHLALAAADLRPRGFSEVKAADRSSPELPDYDKIAHTGQIWRDLEGYATRYGDVRELLEDSDDRIAIVNAGDELRLRFHAPAAPPAGWKRDFIMVADGWIKDGDFNTTFSSTILPLPYHGMKDYVTPPGRLEDDPAWRMHPDDWRRFHTRYVTADGFKKALRD